MDVLLGPHNDDVELFAAFTALRFKPHVVVVTRSYKQGENWARREIETARAMEILGCTWEQWTFPDTNVHWPEVRKQITALRDSYDRCFAPYPRFASNGWSGDDPIPPDGVCQHDRIGEIARAAFDGRYVGYLTYTKAGKDENGVKVPYEPEWVELKLRALLCHESQIVRPEIVEHFLRDQHEFYATDAQPEGE